MINIDITLLIQLVNFLVALAIINYLIIRPVRGVIARRRAQNDELRGRADTLMDEADLKMEGYTARIAQARMHAAGEEARAIHRAAADRVQAESAEAQRELDGRVGEFVQVALKSMLG